MNFSLTLSETSKKEGRKLNRLNILLWILVLYALLSNNRIFAQEFQDDWHLKIPSWDSYYYGNSEYDYSKVVEDTLFLFSEFWGDSIDVDPTAAELWIDDDDNAHFSGIVFVAKYNVHSGSFIEAKKLLEIPSHLNGGGQVLNIFDYAVSPSGKLIVVGNCINGIDFDGSAASAGFYGSGSAVSFASFYESDGTYLGHIEYDLNYTGTPYASSYNNAFEIFRVCVDEMENIYLTGTILGTADLDFTAGTQNEPSAGYYDCGIVKVNGVSETFDWGFRLGGTSTEYIVYNEIVDNKLVLLGAYGSASLDLDPSTGSQDVTNPMTCCDWTFMASYDLSGNFSHGGAIGGTTEFNLYDFDVDVNGNMFLLAGLDADVPFDLDPGAANVDPHYKDFLIHYNSDFSVASVASFSEYGMVEKISASNYYTALYGYFDPAEELIVHSSVTLDSDTISAGADGGMFVVPMAVGSLSLGTPAIYPHSYDRYSYAYTGTSDESGNFYFSGTFYDAIDFTAFDGIDTPDTATFAVNNVPDVFVAKLAWTGFVNLEESDTHESPIKVYPNPAASFLTIESEEAISKIRVMDMTGKVVFEFLPQNIHQQIIDISGYTAGIYFFEITSADGNTDVVKVVAGH
jgi:hypothetical protein